MKPRWPRFSLRTLIIAVLGIALCWTLTATWGVSTVFDYYRTFTAFTEQSGNTMRIVIVGVGEDVTPDREWIIHCTAISPFFVRAVAKRINGDADEIVETYFWFFGYYVQIQTTAPIQVHLQKK